MKKLLFFSVIVSTAIVVSNCSKAPVYPDTPQIEFTSFTEYTSNDSITINLNFKDGDGDLGLSQDDKFAPFQEYDFVKNGSLYVEISDSPTNPPYSCKNYLIGQYNPDALIDTVRIISNPNHFNYFVEFYEKQGASFVPVDFSNTCPDWNGRFPLLAGKEDKGPIEGKLSYTLRYISFDFSGKTLKFKVYIQDRALNKSNVIETPEITID